MNWDTQQIDAIVQAVLQQLQTQREGLRSDREVSPMLSERANERGFGATQSSPVPPTSVPAGTLRVAGRLITSEMLAGRLKGVDCLQIEARAVVTPLVRDLLRQSKIRLERVASIAESATKKTGNRWLLVREDNTLAQRLAQSSVVSGHWQWVSSVEELLRAVSTDAATKAGRAVIVTPRWAEQLWQIAPHAPGPVASVDSVETVRDAQQQLQPMIFVVNSSRRSESQVAMILQEIARL